MKIMKMSVNYKQLTKIVQCHMNLKHYTYYYFNDFNSRDYMII